MDRNSLLAILIAAVCFCTMAVCFKGCTEVRSKIKSDCIQNAPNVAFCRDLCL